MTKPELIDELASKTGVSKKDCTNVIDAFQDIVKETLIKGDKLQLVGFGTFEVAERAERTASTCFCVAPLNSLTFFKTSFFVIFQLIPFILSIIFGIYCICRIILK